MQVSMIAIDLAKTIFQLCGVNQAGKPQFNKSIRRNKLLSFLKDYPDAVIAMEACSGSNYWGRMLEQLGYKVLLIPPIHVKPFAGDGKGYKNGRHFAANIGLVPKEHSSGGVQKLGGITKRGNRYLRRLLVQGAWSVLRNIKGKTDRLSRWAQALVERRGKHKAVVAIANKMARIIWSMLFHRTEYQPR